MKNFFDFGIDKIHLELPQLKSQEKALKIKQSDISVISPDSVRIKGSGKDEYTVTLHSCTCDDFRKNKKSDAPCKHMYRYAMDRGVFQLPVFKESDSDAFSARFAEEINAWKKEYLSGLISLEQFIKIMDAFSK